jgi:filamentous hemagglutinin
VGGGGIGSAIQGAAGAGMSSALAGKLNEMAGSIGEATGSATLGNVVSNVLAGLSGALVGGTTGAVTASNADRFNRQLHPDEKKWISETEAAYAKKYGVTLEQAHNELTTQANLQVQNGSSGTWNQRAYDFLSQAHGLLPADGNSGPGYMFYATPEQRANVEMYAKYYPNGQGMNVPNGQAIANSAGRDKAYQDSYGKLTLGAAVGAAGIALGGPIAALPGAPIFSTGGALGSGALTSKAGTGVISAGINAGSQYWQNGKIDPVGVAGAFATGIAGTYNGGGLGWNVVVNTVGGATTTALGNVLYRTEDSVVFGMAAGAISSVFGFGVGKIADASLSGLLRPTLNSNSSWSSVGQWAGPSGLNVFGPNNLPAIGASVGGSIGGEAAGTAANGVKGYMEHRK